MSMMRARLTLPKICYHGPTSLMHDPPSLDESLLALRPADSIGLASSAMEGRSWEAFATGNGALRIGIPENMLTELLRLYWSWISPLFMWVYRPAFMRMNTCPAYLVPLTNKSDR